MGPPVCVLIIKVILLERLINNTNRSLGTGKSVLIIDEPIIVTELLDILLRQGYQANLVVTLRLSSFIGVHINFSGSTNTKFAVKYQ